MRVLQRAGHFLRVGQDVRAVNLPEVDAIDAEPRERCVDGEVQIIGAAVIGRADDDPALGRQHDLVAQAFVRSEYAAKQRFGRTEGFAIVRAVNVGGVEQGDPGVERCIDQRAGGSKVIALEAPHAPGETADGNARLAERAGNGGRGERSGNGHEKLSILQGREREMARVDCRSISSCGRRRCSAPGPMLNNRLVPVLPSVRVGWRMVVSGG